jgi:hypothetical protein
MCARCANVTYPQCPACKAFTLKPEVASAVRRTRIDTPTFIPR